MAMVLTYDESAGVINTIIATWTSDGSGDAAATSKKISGEIVKAITDPGATAPTADYDIVVTDDNSFNIFTNTDDDLVDRHTSTTEEVYFFEKDHAGTPAAQPVRPVVNSVLTITVSNAGATKDGVLKLFWSAVVR
jgi:hypothetical protein|tara:strand:- start:6491 stop:6898 length:408 start_codon:yes stop_codon:yes gene_type:complete